MSELICKKVRSSGGPSIVFGVGARQKRCKSVFPVFLPFWGCPGHCVYCAQDRQTGRCAASPVPALVAEAEKALDALSPCAESGPRELAFYGGTFTALPEEERLSCLAMLERVRSSGRITHARCSTRPDALSVEVLAELKSFGVSLIELGIQSFDSAALCASRRGYDGETALAACRTVQEAGFELGIQLLPGMPGCTPEVFLKDAELALSLRPSCLRFYPCLVPEGTVLARWLEEGRYVPWSMEETVSVLGRALCRAWQEDVPVIRLSVAPEPAFDAAVLAGPRHPALGALIQAEALLTAVQEAAGRLPGKPEELILPRSCQGFLYGDKGALRPRLAALGLTPERISFKDGERAELRG